MSEGYLLIWVACGSVVGLLIGVLVDLARGGRCSLLLIDGFAGSVGSGTLLLLLNSAWSARIRNESSALASGAGAQMIIFLTQHPLIASAAGASILTIMIRTLLAIRVRLHEPRRK